MRTHALKPLTQVHCAFEFIKYSHVQDFITGLQAETAAPSPLYRWRHWGSRRYSSRGRDKWQQLIEKDLLLWHLTPWLVLAFCFWSSWQWAKTLYWSTRSNHRFFHYVLLDTEMCVNKWRREVLETQQGPLTCFEHLCGRHRVKHSYTLMFPVLNSFIR